MTREKTFPLSLEQLTVKKNASGATNRSAQPGKAPSYEHSLNSPGRSDSSQLASHNEHRVTGLGLDSERTRYALIERLQRYGISDKTVLNAIATIPRHLFVDSGLASQAYEDTALPIGYEQTISKPSIVAYMISHVRQNYLPEQRLIKVLEIGTGCGYQAAVLSQLAHEVYSIERIKPLFEKAKQNLRPLRLANLRLHHGDGTLGLPDVAPFEAIIVAAAGMAVPETLRNQLAIGGRLIAPIVHGKQQVLKMIERQSNTLFQETILESVLFVPLKSGLA